MTPDHHPAPLRTATGARRASLRYDAIVVGARVAGAATAMLLARAGLRVLVVDRGRPGTDTLSTHALMRGGVVQLHRWGLLDRIVDAGTPAVRTTTFRYATDEVVVPIKATAGVDALYAPRRTVLDPLLAAEARAAGADVRYGVTLSGLRRDDRGRVTGIEASASDGGLVAEAPIVIGADGRRSAVASLVGAHVEHAGRVATANIYGYWADVPTEGYEWIFRPGAAAGLIPTNDGLTCAFVGSSPDRVGRGGHEVFDALMEQASPATAERLAAGRRPQGLRTFGGQPGHLRRSWGPGWALVGDAGYWKDPISAHGLTDAMRDAELLARAVLRSAAGDEPEPEALAGYQATRDALSLPLFRVTERLASQDWTDDEIGPILLELSRSMADEVETLHGLDAVPAA